MRYSQIRAFHHVALSGGFSRAAEALNLTQPAISEQVRRLECEHDVLLFNRERKRVTLTQEGRDLLVRTKHFFEAEQEILEVLSQSQAAPKGTLRVIADSAYHLTDGMRAFREMHPKVFVTVQSGNTEEILTALRNYDAEIGVVGSMKPGPDMKVCDLGTSPIVASAAKGKFPKLKSAASLSELADYPIIFREKGSKTREKIEQEGRKQKVILAPVIEVEGREAMQEIVASGAGIGFVSEDEFGYDERVTKIRLKNSELYMHETLVCLKQRSEVRTIRSFMEIFDNLSR